MSGCGGVHTPVATAPPVPSTRHADAPSEAPQARTAHSTQCLDLATCKIACDEGATEACRRVGAFVLDLKTEPAAPYFERACPSPTPVAVPPQSFAKGADAEGC